MNTATIQKITALNTKFYETVADSFAATRTDAWEGWAELVPLLRAQISAATGESRPLRVLDVGCGTGRFAKFLRQNPPAAYIQYLGIDVSESLLTIAQKENQSDELQKFAFQNGEALAILSSLPAGSFDVIVAFGVLHHLPGFATRQHFLAELVRCAAPNALIVFTTWQFLNIPALMAHPLPPAQFGFAAEELEPNDFLLPWQKRNDVARYCHFVDDAERNRLLENLCERKQVKIEKTFAADGKTHDLNHYAILRATNAKKSGNS